MSVKRKKYRLYADHSYIKTIDSGWPMLRILTQLRKSYPDAGSLEVRLHDDSHAVGILG